MNGLVEEEFRKKHETILEDDVATTLFEFIAMIFEQICFLITMKYCYYYMVFWLALIA